MIYNKLKLCPSLPRYVLSSPLEMEWLEPTKTGKLGFFFFFFLHQRGRLTKLGQDGNGRELLLWVWEKRKEESVVRDKLKRVGWDEK